MNPITSSSFPKELMELIASNGDDQEIRNIDENAKRVALEWLNGHPNVLEASPRIRTVLQLLQEPTVMSTVFDVVTKVFTSLFIRSVTDSLTPFKQWVENPDEANTAQLARFLIQAPVDCSSGLSFLLDCHDCGVVTLEQIFSVLNWRGTSGQTPLYRPLVFRLLFERLRPEQLCKPLMRDQETSTMLVRQFLYGRSFDMDGFGELKEFMLEAVRQNSYALVCASPKLLEDKEFVLEAVRQNPSALCYTPSKLLEDKEFVLKAVRQNPFALQHASPKLREDKEFVLEAMRQNPFALQQASAALQQNREFVLEAVQQVPAALGVTLQVLLRSGSQPSDELPQELKKIRNNEILTAFGQIFKLYETDVEQIFEHYPKSWHLQILALCLIARFPNNFGAIQAIIEPLTKEEGPLRKRFRNMQTGLLQSLSELLLFQHPPISSEEIQILFANLPKSVVNGHKKIDPEKFKNQISYIRTFFRLAREEERASLAEILYLPFENQINRFKEIAQSFFALYGAAGTSEAILQSPRIGALITYLFKQSDNKELIPSIQKLVEGISLGRISQERYLASSSAHMQKLADAHSELWESWKTLTFSSEEVENTHEAAFSFRGFLDDKTQNGHLPQDIKEVLLGEFQGEKSEGLRECFSYLQRCIEQEGKLEKTLVEEGIRLFKQHYHQCEFINDLRSLLPQQAGKGRKIELSDHWEDLLVCGTDVLGSCQRVDGDPELNKCLLAYILDGKNRLLCVKDREGKIVSRVILRLLLKEGNTPVLFIEGCYGDQDYAETLRQSAKKISKGLSVELYETRESSQKEMVKLHSLGTSVPYEYCDAAQGVTRGEFSHPGALVDN